MPKGTTSGVRAWPGVVICDTREQLPYAFAGITADKREGGGRLVVPVKRATLASGDYSLEGSESKVAVERKSLADLFGTIARGRARFERELARLQGFDFAAVVIEAEWSEIVNNRPEWSRIEPKTVFRSILSWQQRYRGVHWWAVPGRDMAELVTFRIIDRYMRDYACRLPLSLR